MGSSEMELGGLDEANSVVLLVEERVVLAHEAVAEDEVVEVCREVTADNAENTLSVGAISNRCSAIIAISRGECYVAPILPAIAYAVLEPPLPPAPAVDPVRLLAPLAPPAPAMSNSFFEIALDCSPLICKH